MISSILQVTNVRRLEVLFCAGRSIPPWPEKLARGVRGIRYRGVVVSHPFAQNAKGWGTEIRCCEELLLLQAGHQAV